MRRAIDNYMVGKQKEVNADEFYGLSISTSQRRFICPECGEYVALVYREGIRFFRHTNRTEASPFCDERIDGISGLSLYERVGLPIYLKGDRNSQFELFIGFYALGEDALLSAYNNNLAVIVKADCSWMTGELSVKYNIDTTSFYADQTTLKLISFVPSPGENYKINYSSLNTPKSIKQKWSDYVDGFTSYGAIFTYGENGGRKLRKGDTITTDEKYLLATPENYTPRYKGLVSESVGKLKLQNGMFNIHEICFSSKGSSEIDFINFSNYCFNNLRVTLLHKQPEVLPIWPPSSVVDRSYAVFCNSSEVICGVSSGNDMPTVFEYNGNEAIQIKVHTTSSGKNYICINLNSINKPISVDRKLSGNNIFLNNQFPQNIGTTSITKAFDQTDTEFSFGENRKLPIGGQLCFQSNYKAEILHKKKGHRYIKYRIKDDISVTVKNITKGDEIIVCTHSFELGTLKFHHPSKDTSKQFDDNSLYLSLVSARVPYVPVPFWLFNIVKRLSNYPKSKGLIMKYIIKNEIPIEAIRLLKIISRKDNML
jgi:hypothetical protein